MSFCKFIPALCMLCATTIANAAELKFSSDDRMAVVDGKRTFILGLYENPKDDAVLKEVAAAGFNLVQSQKDPADLDRLHAHSLYAWINTGNDIEAKETDRASITRLMAMAESFKSHPAMLLWEIPDEALWNEWHQALLWRHEEEPAKLSALIEALTDESAQEQLRSDLARVQQLNREGYYPDAEKLADSLWEKLGEASPKPGYGLSDAQARVDERLLRISFGSLLLKSIDPEHRVWMNHAPRNTLDQLAGFSIAADAVGCDIYPVPLHPELRHSDLNNATLSSVGEYTQRMKSAAPNKAIWMVLQGFGWKDLDEGRPDELRRPTKEETRFMAWNAILHGATGIFYWGTEYIEKDSIFWKELLEVVRELADSQDILTAPHANIHGAITYAPTFSSMDAKVEVMAKQVGDKVCLVFVNENNAPLAFSMRGFEAMEGVRFKVRNYENAQPVVENGHITLTMPAYSVYILEPAE